MHLVPKELDKLVISQLGFLAQKRLARGVKLNHTEATVSKFTSLSSRRVASRISSMSS